MSAVRDDNFVVEHGWMVNRLQLKGNDLRVYAIIYGFSQTGGQEFTGNLQYLADWVNGTKQGVQKNLKALLDRGLIKKREYFTNGVKQCAYRATELPPIQQSCTGCATELHGGVQQSCTGYATELHGGMQQSCTNNIRDNIPDNIPDKKESGGQAPSAPEKTTRFKPPTVEEVAAYCLERGNHVDAQRFVDYYTANGWMRGKTKIKDWRACVRTWERGATGGGYQRPQPERSRIKTEADYAAGLQGWG